MRNENTTNTTALPTASDPLTVDADGARRFIAHLRRTGQTRMADVWAAALGLDA